MADGRASFQIDPFARACLLEGVDELGYILAHDDAITAFEQRRKGRLAHECDNRGPAR